MSGASCNKCAVSCCLSTFPACVSSVLFSPCSFKFSAEDNRIKCSWLSAVGLNIDCSNDWSGLFTDY